MVSFNFPTETIIAGLAYSSIAVLIVGLIVVTAIGMYRKKYVYIYRAKILAPRDNGLVVHVGTFPAGVIKRKDGVNDFIIKYGKINPKAKIALGYLPNYSLAQLTADGRPLLTFYRDADATFLQQCAEVFSPIEREIVTDVVTENGVEKKVERVIEHYNVIKPLSTDVKTLTLNRLAEAKKALLSDTVRTTAIVFGALIIMVIGHLIWTWIVNKA